MSAAQRSAVKTWLGALPDVEATFARMDQNGDGSVNAQELRVSGPTVGLPRGGGKALLAMADSDHNGRISLSEFVKLGRTLREVQLLRDQVSAPPEAEAEERTPTEFKPEWRAYLGDLKQQKQSIAGYSDLLHVVGFDEEAFKTMDEDGDGSITAQELRHAFKRTSAARKRGKVAPETLEAIIKLADKDADGRIDFAEFQSMAGLVHELESINKERGLVGDAPSDPRLPMCSAFSRIAEQDTYLSDKNSPDELAKAGTAEVVVTGSGMPTPFPGVAGPGAMVRFDNVYLQFDAGRATVLRLSEINVSVRQLSAVFLTHIHSDHTSSLPDIAMTRDRSARTHRCGCGWGGEATIAPLAPLSCVVPGVACENFVRNMLLPYSDDLIIRAGNAKRGTALPRLVTLRAFQPTFDAPQLVWTSDAHTGIAPGVSVFAVCNHHEPVEDSVAYRIETPRGAIVISGDTRACDEVESLARDAAILVHEACLPHLMSDSKSAVANYHADARAVGALAQRAGVGTLVLTHLTPPPEAPALAALGVDVRAEYEAEARAGGFTGLLVVASDLTRVAL